MPQTRIAFADTNWLFSLYYQTREFEAVPRSVLGGPQVASENWARQCADNTESLMEPCAKLPSFKQAGHGPALVPSIERDAVLAPLATVTEPKLLAPFVNPL